MSGKPLRDILRVPGGPVDLSAHDPGSTRRAPGGKRRTRAATVSHGERLAALQEALYAEGTAGGERRVLVVLQGMDTCGKDGTVKHVIGMLNPQGCHVTAFGVPTAQELAHHFLWRIRRALPGPGQVGIFNRSHYEDVLVARVHELVPPEVVQRRYEEINRFERQLVDSGVAILKCFLHISPEEQRERLLARLADPTKHWKFNPADLAERALWTQYQAAYELALERCNTDAAPWYVVPADHKWYRDWAVSQLLAETLGELNPAYPATDLDVPALTAQLARR